LASLSDAALRVRWRISREFVFDLAFDGIQGADEGQSFNRPRIARLGFDKVSSRVHLAAQMAKIVVQGVVAVVSVGVDESPVAFEEPLRIGLAAAGRDRSASRRLAQQGDRMTDPRLHKGTESFSARHQKLKLRDAKTKMCCIHALHRRIHCTHCRQR
jgi:hypothetical protein